MTRRDEFRGALAQPMGAPPPPAAAAPAAPPEGPAKPPPVRETARDWSARQRLKAGEALRYSRFVGVMKRVLPIAAVVLMGLVIAYSVMPRRNDRMMAVTHSGNLSRDLTMTKSSFTGTDEKGNPFKITAAEVIQDPAAKNKLKAELKQVDADMQFENDTWISASAAHGFIDGDAGILTLDGGISVFSDNGYEMHTKSAIAHIKSNILEGNEGVKGHGPIGQFSADRFYFDRAKKQMRLMGHVHMTLYPQKANRR